MGNGHLPVTYAHRLQQLLCSVRGFGTVSSTAPPQKCKGCTKAPMQLQLELQQKQQDGTVRLEFSVVSSTLRTTGKAKKATCDICILCGESEGSIECCNGLYCLTAVHTERLTPEVRKLAKDKRWLCITCQQRGNNLTS
jgi:hypothetical protein